MTNKLYQQYRGLLREHRKLQFKKLEIEGIFIEKINVTEVTCICPTSKSLSQKKRSRKTRSLTAEAANISISILKHELIAGGTYHIGAYAYNKFSEKSPEDLKRVNIDCTENNYGCYMNRCWKNCGPHLDSGDFRLTTNSISLSVKLMISCNTMSECNPCFVCATCERKKHLKKIFKKIV